MTHAQLIDLIDSLVVDDSDFAELPSMEDMDAVAGREMHEAACRYAAMLEGKDA